MRGLKPPPPSGKKTLGQSGGGVPWLTPTSQNRDVGHPKCIPQGLKPSLIFWRLAMLSHPIAKSAKGWGTGQYLENGG